MGSAVLTNKQFVPICRSEWIVHLCEIFEADFIAQRVIKPGKIEFDLALLMSQHRPLTQRIATYIYESGYHGIQYPSRHGGELVNWAIFEPFNLENEERSDLQPHDPDFQAAIEHFNLEFDPSL